MDTVAGGRSYSSSTGPPPAVLGWSHDISKRIREGDWPTQAVSTVQLIEQAIGGGQLEPAAQLVDYFMEEAKVVYVIYDVWSAGFAEYLAGRGVSGNELESELARLRALLTFPDGGAFAPAERWRALASLAGTLAHRLRAYDLEAGEALRLLDELREGWRQLHDRYADWQAGLLTFVASRFG